MANANLRREGESDVAPALTARSLTVRHGDRTVLGPLDLDVYRGETVGLLGPNGSGKTSLLRALAGISAPSAGHVSLHGTELERIPLRRRARLIASVAQDEHTELPFTARDVLLLGRAAGSPDWRPYRRDDHDFVEHLAELWSLTELLDRSLREMSGGERRRVLIARAFAQEANVQLFDEPTNHLDLKHQHALLEHLADSAATTVLALHDIDLALACCSRLIVLEHGTIVADGPASTVVTASLIERVYDVRAREVLVDGRPTVVVGR